MAYMEPMDVDHIGSDFDDKENSIQNSNVLPRTPCTEKGYEELDVSELNMKLRYSITPASSPMSKSYNANFKENKYMNQEDMQNTTITNENCNLSRSLNSALTKSDTVSKSPKLPLQVVLSDQFCNNSMSSIRRSIDTDKNCTITLREPENIDENLSLPSTSSSLVHTPEAITPTKDISKDDGGSPIIRGLKSVLNMFRSSQSPIPPEEISSKDMNSLDPVIKDNLIPSTTLSSTPINTNKMKECSSSKRNSPLKDSVTFSDDLEKELEWKEETTIFFKQEKIPIQKLLFQQPPSLSEQKTSLKVNENVNSAVEYMDISYNESGIADKTMTEIGNKTTSKVIETTNGIESDSEFVDCETTYTKNEEQSESELNALVTDNNEINKTHDITSEAIENIITKDVNLGDGEVNCVNLISDKNDNDVKIGQMNVTFENLASETQTILPDILNTHDIIHGNDEKCDIENNLISNDVILNVTGNISVLSEVQSETPSEFNDDINIQLENNIISEMNNQVNLQEQITSVNESKQEIKSENEECNVHDVTKPLNIITDFQNVENTNIENLDNSYAQKNDDDLNSLEKLGLLKRYDIEDNVTKTEIIPNNTKEEINNITVNQDNSICLIHPSNESVSIGKTDISANTILSNVEDNIQKDVLDINNDNIIETSKIELPDEVRDVVSKEHENICAVIHCDNLSFQNPLPLDVTFNNTHTNNTHCTRIDESNDVNINNKLEDIISEEHITKEEVQEPLPAKVNNVPSDCPLPFDDDVDNHNFKESLDIELNNTKNENNDCKDVLKEESNVTLEEMQVENKDIDNVEAVIIVPNELELFDGTANKTIEITDCPKSIEFETSPNHHIIHIASDNNTIMNSSSNDNMQSLEKNNLSSNEEKSIEENKLIDSEMVSPRPLNTFTCDDVADNFENNVNLENIENPFETKTRLQESPPISPKLSRKGYTINFDEIDDPFATKTNIRTSPPPETSSKIIVENKSQKKMDHKRIQMQNRRKSQPERKKQNSTKKPFNKSFESGLTKCKDKETVNVSRTSLHDDQDIKMNIEKPNVCLDEKYKELEKVEPSKVHDVPVNKDYEIESQNEEKFIVKETQNENLLDNKMSEIECAKNSSAVNKSVFNLPEIDDINFNPFATNTKVRQSPPPTTQTPKVLNEENEGQLQVFNDVTINIENTIEGQKNVSPSSSSINSSKNTDSKDSIAQETKTEDEDTIEGPFFEADELDEAEKLSAFELKNDVMPFEDFPVQSNADKKEELFIDAEAFEYLLNQNKSNVVTDSGKESLFLKFDPLFAKRVSSDGVLSALNRIQKRQSTPIKSSNTDKINETIEPAAPSTSAKSASEVALDESNIMISKPMMVVNPAVNSLVSPRKSMTPPRINRRSLTYTSPAMAVIDRLLSLSGNTSLLDHETSIPQPTRDCNDTDIALTQLRELLAEKEIHVHNLRSETKELKERLAAMESQVRTLEKESGERLRKVNDLNDRLAEKTKMNKSMAVVVEEYERTIASLIAEMDQEKRRNAEERAMLTSERDEQTAHLASMEVSFNDLHSKYEKTKQIILSMKANEDTYKKSIKDFEENLLKMQNNYELLKQHATSKMNHANQELEKFNRSHEAEVLKLNAMIKRKELHITSLEESLTQKTKANEELTAICDELINKVG